jgi:hypothetical protein
VGLVQDIPGNSDADLRLRCRLRDAVAIAKPSRAGLPDFFNLCLLPDRTRLRLFFPLGGSITPSASSVNKPPSLSVMSRST